MGRLSTRASEFIDRCYALFDVDLLVCIRLSVPCCSLRVYNACVHLLLDICICTSNPNDIATLNLRYKFDTPFEREIKSEVFKIVRRGREFGTPGYFARVVFYLSFFGVLQYLFATSTDFMSAMELPFVSEKIGFGIWKGVVLAIWFGIAQAFIGLNVQVSFALLFLCWLLASRYLYSLVYHFELP